MIEGKKILKMDYCICTKLLNNNSKLATSNTGGDDTSK